MIQEAGTDRDPRRALPQGQRKPLRAEIGVRFRVPAHRLRVCDETLIQYLDLLRCICVQSIGDHCPLMCFWHRPLGLFD